MPVDRVCRVSRRAIGRDSRIVAHTLTPKGVRVVTRTPDDVMRDLEEVTQGAYGMSAQAYLDARRTGREPDGPESDVAELLAEAISESD